MLLIIIWFLSLAVHLTSAYPTLIGRRSEGANGGQKTLSVSLQNVGVGLHVAQLYVGTPPQPILMTFDTGTSDTWIRLFNSTDCKLSTDEPCRRSEKLFLDSENSSSFKSLGAGFSMIYGSGSVNGTWATETFMIGNVNISNYQFGAEDISEDLAMPYGIVGLGLKGFESTYTYEYGIKQIVKNTYYTEQAKYQYDNFPARLKKSGAIIKNCYSIIYPEKGKAQCEYIFGGVDVAKYDSLITVPVIQKSVGDWQDYNEPILLAVDLKQVNVTYGGQLLQILGKNYPTLIDTLTYFLAAPEKVVANLETLLGGEYSSELYGIYYECDSKIGLSFDFGGKSLEVSADSLSEKKGAYCFFPVKKNTDDFMILGSTFLSNFYTFFDLDGLTISFGSYKNVEKLQIQEIGLNQAPPNSQLVPQASSTFEYSDKDIISLNYTSKISAKGEHGPARIMKRFLEAARLKFKNFWKDIAKKLNF